MNYLNKEQTRDEINRLSASNKPFLFLIDFKGERAVVAELSELARLGISCRIEGVEMGRRVKSVIGQQTAPITVEPMSFESYKQSFDQVIKAIEHGDSYLLNLTFATCLGSKVNLEQVYHSARARYKFMLKDQFVFYSPEPFLRIEDEKIYSFPMKGTIDGQSKGAREELLSDKKELYEHYTIVDLIRNDLSMIADDVQVEEFRYVDTIDTHRGAILQTSSRISGKLNSDWRGRLGDILLTMLPAGSVSGAPKERSVQIIEQAESSERGFYTGVMGVCARGRVDSCVNIRYMERAADGKVYYRSGGGITAMSSAKDEYDELFTKIYVPTI